MSTASWVSAFTASPSMPSFDCSSLRKLDVHQMAGLGLTVRMKPSLSLRRISSPCVLESLFDHSLNSHSSARERVDSRGFHVGSSGLLVQAPTVLLCQSCEIELAESARRNNTERSYRTVYPAHDLIPRTIAAHHVLQCRLVGICIASFPVTGPIIRLLQDSNSSRMGYSRDELLSHSPQQCYRCEMTPIGMNEWATYSTSPFHSAR